MDFGKNLRQLRSAAGLTQKELASLMGTTEAQISRWENGDKKPSFDNIISLISILNVSADDILCRVDNDGMQFTSEERSIIIKFRRLDDHGKLLVSTICDLEYDRMMPDYKNPAYHQNVPIFLTPIAAGTAAPNDESYSQPIQSDKRIPEGADYAVKIRGDSMEPVLYDGDVVFVKKTSEIVNGDIGVFNIDGASYCKQYYKYDNGDVVLLSANQRLKHTNISIPRNSGRSAVCQGVVILDRHIPLPKYFRP